MITESYDGGSYCYHFVPGILETGLFVNMAQKVYFGQEDGTVKTRGD